MLWKDYLKTRDINVAGMALREAFLRLDAGLRDKVNLGVHPYTSLDPSPRFNPYLNPNLNPNPS